MEEPKHSQGKRDSSIGDNVPLFLERISFPFPFFTSLMFIQSFAPAQQSLSNPQEYDFFSVFWVFSLSL